MQSRLVGGLYLAGELLDIDADTGGYNLQIAYSTGIWPASCWRHNRYDMDLFKKANNASSGDTSGSEPIST